MEDIKEEDVQQRRERVPLADRCADVKGSVRPCAVITALRAPTKPEQMYSTAGLGKRYRWRVARIESSCTES